MPMIAPLPENEEQRLEWLRQCEILDTLPEPPKDTLALVAHRIPVEMHHHHAVQLFVSLDRPYPATLDGQRREATEGFLIDADVPHACQSADSKVALNALVLRGMSIAGAVSGRLARQRQASVDVDLSGDDATPLVVLEDTFYDRGGSAPVKVVAVEDD